MFDSFIYGPGIHTEVKITDFNSKNPYNNGSLNQYSYLSVKIDAGYNFVAKYDYTPFKGNVSYARLALVWGIGNF